MGKWATVTFPEGFDKREEELKDMTNAAINDLWIYYGSLSLSDFANMEWYCSRSNRWACIDNCESKDAPAMFKVFCKYTDYIEDEKRIIFEKMCICLAVEFNAPRAIKKEIKMDLHESDEKPKEKEEEKDSTITSTVVPTGIITAFVIGRGKIFEPTPYMRLLQPVYQPSCGGSPLPLVLQQKWWDRISHEWEWRDIPIVTEFSPEYYK